MAPGPRPWSCLAQVQAHIQGLKLGRCLHCRLCWWLLARAIAMFSWPALLVAAGPHPRAQARPLPHCPTPVMAGGHAPGEKPGPGAVNSQKAWPTASDPVAISSSSTGKSLSLPPAQARAQTTGPTYSPCLQAPGFLCRALPATEHPALLHMSGYLSSPMKLSAAIS